MPLTPGTKLAHYEVVESIGAGGMGEVYRARDTKLGRDIAIKVLPEEFARDKERLDRFEREARLLAQLNHPNIATLHGLEEYEGQRFLVMELVEGETLAERIADGPIRVDEAIPLFIQIAEGLEAAHEKGIIHRDLKPANIKVGPDGRPKILDFGLAKATLGETVGHDLSQSPTLTRDATETGVLLGTAPYMSPEQARGKPIDARTDIWAFGCCLYEALTGRAAFRGETVSDTIAGILKNDPEWSALPSRSPTVVRRLLRRCLQKEPSERLHHIADARIEMAESLAEPWIAENASATKIRWPLIAASLAIGILLGTVLWNWMRPGDMPEPLVSRLTVSIPQDQALSWANDPSVAISPDGRQIAFVGGGGGGSGGDTTRRIYLRSLDHLEARPIPGTETAQSVFFSPDGEWIGFYAGAKLAKVRLDSGMHVTLLDSFELIDTWGGSWGRDDTFVVCIDGGLARVSGSENSYTVLTTPDVAREESGYRFPDLLPDGKSVLFTIVSTTGGFQIGIASLATGAYHVLIEKGSFARYAPTGHIIYSNEDTLLAVPFDLDHLELAGEPFPVVKGVWNHPAFGTAHFAVAHNGTLIYVPHVEEERELVWVDRTGSVRPMTTFHRVFEDPRLSPDGQRVSLTIQAEGKKSIWLYEISRDSFLRLTFGSEDDQGAIWTPDGTRLTFRRGLSSNLFTLNSDGGDAEVRLTTSPYSQRPDSWSPDGTLVYSEDRPSTTGRDLWSYHREGEPKQKPLLQTHFGEPFGAVSPDGRFLAYQSNESGTREIYVRPFPEGVGKWRISSQGGNQPVWARNGRELFYRNGDSMMVVTVETESGFRAGSPNVLFEGKFLLPTGSFPQYDVTADGERFVMVRELNTFPTQIHVVLNWPEDLERLLRTNN